MLSDIETVCNDVQPRKVDSSILVKLPEIIALIKEVQVVKAFFAIAVTLLGMLISVMDVHCPNEYSPMVSRPVGNKTLVKLGQL